MEPTTPSGGRRTRQLQSAVRGVRERRPAATDREGDPELLSLVQTPFTDPEETERRLRALRAAFEARDDRRAVFLSIYAPMTAAVAGRVRRGEFADPDWVGAYLVAFANLYRAAVYAHETGDTDALATPWQLAFEAADHGRSLVVQDAALGVNAHINYDLALALDTVGVGTNRAQKQADHDAVIEVITDLVDEAQASLADRDADGLAVLDDSLGRFDERVTVFTIDECRDSAWQTAVAMGSRFRLRRRFARWVSDVTATGAAHIILSSQASDVVHGTLADLEGSSGDDNETSST